MGVLGPRVLDVGLSALDAECDAIFVCSADPTTYSQATTAGTYALGSRAFTQGSVFGSPSAGSPDGRSTTSVAITDGIITNTGTVSHWAAVDSTTSRLLARGVVTGGIAVTGGQSFTLGAVTVNLSSLISSGYQVSAVNFDGATSYAYHTGTFGTGPNSGVGLVSFWLKMQGGDAAFQGIMDNGNNDGQILRMTDNTIRFFASKFNFSTTATFASGGSWRHVMVAWDVSIARMQVYVDGVSDIAGGATSSSGPINYATAIHWSIGVDPSSHSQFFLNGDLSELYVNLAETLDLTDSAKVQKFRTVGGKPVDLGTDGSTPTGTQPFMYMKNPFGSYGINAGSAGDFESTAGLTAASTSPST